MMDLYALNRIVNMADGSVPLKIWLKNAVALSSGMPEAHVFHRALAQLERWR